MYRLHQFGVVLMTPIALATFTHGQVAPCEMQKLTASDAALLDLFGNSVSISGDAAIIGAWNNDGPFEFAWGSAYLFRFIDGSWIEEQAITPSDANSQDRFGHTVAISGDVAVVGSPMNDDACPPPDNIFCDSGSAYVFRFENGSWIEKQKLIAFDDEAIDQYGISVSVSGDVIVIGAPWQDEACGGGPDCNAGAAYVYRFTGETWELDQKLMASDPDFGDAFGLTVSISGNTILVGAPRNNDDGSNSGSAYIFQFDGDNWNELQKLTASDAQVSDEFGWGVSINGDLALIGAGRDDTACPENISCDSGSAYVFRFDGKLWVQEQKLEAPDMALGDQFGRSVSIDGDYALVGSRWNDDLCPEDPDCDSGAAYLFHFGSPEAIGWSLQQKLTQSDADVRDLYGSAVAVSGTSVIVGSEGDDDDGTGSGSAYFYALDGPDADSDGIADTCDNCPGTFNPNQEDSDEDGIGDACQGILGDFSTFRGFYDSGDLNSLLDSDDDKLCYNPGIVLNPTEAPITLDFFGFLPNDSPASLDVTIESSANTVGLELTISFWNYNTNSWDVVGTDTQSLNADTVRTFAGIPTNHVEPVTGEVMTRYEVRVVGFIFLFPWLDCVDHVFWTISG